MRELSLHILDLIENSIRADASVIDVSITETPEEDLLEIMVEDNGSGLSVPAEEVLSPFYTTKTGKRTGLGLSLFRTTSEQAGGSLTLGKSAMGGVSVKARMRLGSIDRNPLGDLAATLSSVVCTNPHIDLRCRLRTNTGECTVRVSEVAQEFRVNERCGLAIARRMSEKIRYGLKILHSTA